MPEVDTTTTVLGHELTVPFLLPPFGRSHLFWPRGEAAASAAAGKAGTLYAL